MAPLSQELAGLIISIDHIGSPLDQDGITIKEKIEKLNVDFTGLVNKLWSTIAINDYPACIRYIGSGEVDFPILSNFKRYSERVPESQCYKLWKLITRIIVYGQEWLVYVTEQQILSTTTKVKQTADHLIVANEELFLSLPFRLALHVDDLPK